MTLPILTVARDKSPETGRGVGHMESQSMIPRLLAWEGQARLHGRVPTNETIDGTTESYPKLCDLCYDITDM